MSEPLTSSLPVREQSGSNWRTSFGVSKTTPEKLRQLGAFLNAHAAICSAASRRGFDPNYVYFDMNAGEGMPWLDGRQLVGSPLLAVRACHGAGMPVLARLFEKDLATTAALCDALGGVYGDVEIVTGDHHVTAVRSARDVSSSLHANALGLVFVDPFAPPLPGGLVREMLALPRLGRIDVLAYVSGTAYKRMGRRLLAQEIESFGKPFVWLREPEGPWQWTFALLTATDNFDWTKKSALRLHRSDSRKGNEIMDRLLLTEAERCKNGVLFEDAG